MDELLAWIYPNRVAIAIATAAALAVLGVVAWRRGWLAIARRHPGRSAILAVIAVAIALPMTWYLASPLVIRTTLAEPAPSAAAAPQSAAATPQSAAAPAAMTRSGMFVGADEFHFAHGTASLIETAPGRFTLRFEGFSVRNGPDLYVYLSPDPGGYVEDAVELGTLKATDGDFNYELPPTIDVATIRSVVIWCKAFSVEFGAASLPA